VADLGPCKTWQAARGVDDGGVSSVVADEGGAVGLEDGVARDALALVRPPQLPAVRAVGQWVCM
jgi:hypothetical protein